MSLQYYTFLATCCFESNQKSSLKSMWYISCKEMTCSLAHSIRNRSGEGANFSTHKSIGAVRLFKASVVSFCRTSAPFRRYTFFTVAFAQHVLSAFFQLIGNSPKGHIRMAKQIEAKRIFPLQQFKAI